MNDNNLLKSIQHKFLGRDTQYPTVDGNIGSRRYLDSAASTLMMTPAFEVAKEFLEHYASTHSKLHYAAKGASEAFDWAHQRVLKFVGADEKVYSSYFAGSGATAGFNRIATELSTQRAERDIVLVSEMEHHSNDLPHRAHAGEVVHIPAMGEGAAYGGIGVAVVNALIDKYGERINYIAVTGASNVTGAVTPIHEIAQLAHSVGAYIVIDASQMIAHAPVSMDDADLDVLVFSGHKIYAPGSPGVVIAKTSLLADMSPSELGGGMVTDVYLERYMTAELLPDREEAGTPNIVGGITLGAVLEVLMRIGMDNIRKKEIGMIDMLWEKLSAIEEVNLYGPAPGDVPRTGTMTFNIKGFDHGLTAAALNDYHNIQVRNGCFCAHPYVREMLKRELWDMDLDPNALNAEDDIERKRGMARASIGLHNSEEDLQALVEAIKDLITREDEIHKLYEPFGSNGYRHREYAPDEAAIFNPMVALEKALKA
ncbi:MAG: aminotransferase class V-fold PLP-dependent enzyme [Gammaproteobacteria bacterium]|nr:aminotransferase class V-fold PLP-dependent enzyme [Gammaproteobacteria bacterium]